MFTLLFVAAFGVVALIGAMIMLAISMLIRRRGLLLAFLLVFPAFGFLWAYVPGIGYADGKTNGLVMALCGILTFGGFLGVIFVEVMRSRWERKLTNEEQS